ncbi:MAG TPA: dihydroxyacetone kinase subunit DhaL [Pararhizobium sp.]|uniref:dihydroxyacetone kinase subunit DhaL n=1 Tax=Pararhizobium sp. TaxID=1977563 RepID=UPI002B9A7CAA|nr:dihydroxyacetone kinase subunit DhaL [Pararhizobium sp.]HTO34306.1 dihydroxyacetone kinase subunit DhaL [Pararhizobium sp.]
MTKTKKLMNSPETIIPEMIEGMLGAHSDILTSFGATGRVLVAIDGPRDGKVGIVVGGGSGHEPAFSGYVGRGLADASAIGNVFASPSPEPILEATRAANGGAGVLYLYGNYSGDVMNFDMAAEHAKREGIEVRSIPVTDDVASATSERTGDRRGIAGDFFVFKIAGAAADRMGTLDEVEAVTRKANRLTATMGVALGACSLPQTLKPNFEIGDDQMEIGMGVHGEPGIRRAAVETADEVTAELMEHIQGELKLVKGDKVALLVNGLGSTSPMELYLLHRRAKLILDDLGVGIHRSFVGEYVTSLEMAGASITLLKLDDELTSLLDHPCLAPALRVGPPPVPVSQQFSDRLKRIAAEHPTEAKVQAASTGAVDGEGDLTAAIFAEMVRKVSFAIEDRADWLSELDGVIGDGDHGVTMGIGWRAVRTEIAEIGARESIEEICRRIAKAFLDAVGASSGPLYASAFLRAGETTGGRQRLDPAGVVAFLNGASNGVRERGKAEPGDKTMVDAWVPAVEQAQRALAEGGDIVDCLRAAAAGAERGMKATANIAARRGRSAKLGERSLGHIDPGSASTFLMIDAMRQSFETQTLDPVSRAQRPSRIS